MPKRDATPPPSDDEPRFLTVVHPYPLRANPELAGDKKQIALWLACIARDHQPLFNFYHKPTSPGMIILEVDRDFDRFEDLLGLHEWSKMLGKPTEEEVKCNSRIFHCLYTTARQVTKLGWKQVMIDESWFVDWSPNNKIMQYPYPKSTWCDVPLENKTLTPLCRPLPVQHFQPPPVEQAPPVGSAQWHEAKAQGTLPEKARGRKGKSASSRGTSQGASTSNASASKVQLEPKPPRPEVPATGISHSQLLSARAHNPAPSLPPGLNIVRKGKQSVSPGLSPSGSRSGSSGSPVQTPVDAPSRRHSPAQGFINWAEDVEAASAYGAPSYGDSISNVGDGYEDAPGPPIPDHDGADDADDVDVTLPSAYVVHETRVTRNGDAPDGLWTDYRNPKPDEPFPWQKRCPTHWTTCAGGVCIVYTKWKKEQEKEKEEKERAAQQGQERTKRKKQRPREQITESDFWRRPNQDLNLSHIVPSSSTSSSESPPSSGRSSVRSSIVSSPAPFSGPATHTVPTTTPASSNQHLGEEWDNDGRMSNWDQDETRSVASTARHAWSAADDAANSERDDDVESIAGSIHSSIPGGAFPADDDDAQSVASSRPDWNVSESSMPWDHSPSVRGAAARGKTPAKNAWGTTSGRVPTPAGAWASSNGPSRQNAWATPVNASNQRAQAVRDNQSDPTPVQAQQYNKWTQTQKPSTLSASASPFQPRGQQGSRSTQSQGDAWRNQQSETSGFYPTAQNSRAPSVAPSEDDWGNVSSSSDIW